ncbi:MAG TPA: 50S ribosomal protein L24 [Solirubrobacteraceae bacterium]|nr:50S ribosomal protein L24 [Solirubrobacteraceae bacterium]
MRRAATSKRKLKIRSGDHVQVIAGKDRGKRGRVLRVDPRRQRVYVEGMNMVKRHVRPKASGRQLYPGTEGQLAGVIDTEAGIHVSNVMLLDPKGQPTRVGIERQGGQRSRVAKRSGTTID